MGAYELRTGKATPAADVSVTSTAAVSVLAANPRRVKAVIQNNSTGGHVRVTCSTSTSVGAPTATRGIKLTAGGSYIMDGPFIERAAVRAIGSTGLTSKVGVTEIIATPHGST